MNSIRKIKHIIKNCQKFSNYWIRDERIRAAIMLEFGISCDTEYKAKRLMYCLSVLSGERRRALLKVCRAVNNKGKFISADNIYRVVNMEKIHKVDYRLIPTGYKTFEYYNIPLIISSINDTLREVFDLVSNTGLTKDEFWNMIKNENQGNP